MKIFDTYPFPYTSFLDPLRKKLNVKSLREYGRQLGIRNHRFWTYVKNAVEVSYIDERWWIILEDDDDQEVERYLLTLEEMMAIPELEPYAHAMALQQSHDGVGDVDFDDTGTPVVTTDGNWTPKVYDFWTMKEADDEVH